MGRLVMVALLLVASTRTHATEFELRSRTIGQAYQLRSLRTLAEDISLGRYRFSQVLSLSIWDMFSKRDRYQVFAQPKDGPRIYLTTYLRLDHDFGRYSRGTLRFAGTRWDALDLLPELQEDVFDLDMLYGFVAAEGLWNGMVDIHLGRQLTIGSMDWWSMDGASTKVYLPIHVAVSGFGGLRVRDSSFLGDATYELDGTSSAECTEYVEGAVPGAGSWRPVDRGTVIVNNPFTSDFELCPQRQALMPTFGGSVSVHGIDFLDMALTYRRTVSKTAGAIEPTDRLLYPDLGVYPDDFDQAPAWGVNEEHVTAMVRGRIGGGTDQKAMLIPYAGVRYSLLHGLVDQAHVSTLGMLGRHEAELEWYYNFPTFDGDSIFNVFSIQPYHDMRTTYRFRMDQRWSLLARPWIRIYSVEQEDLMTPAGMVSIGNLSYGGQLGARFRGSTLSVRADAFADAGYGGARVGGYGTMMWRVDTEWRLSSQLNVVHSRADTSAAVFTTGSAQVGVTRTFEAGVGLHWLSEVVVNPQVQSAWRFWLMVDLQFTPEI